MHQLLLVAMIVFLHGSSMTVGRMEGYDRRNYNYSYPRTEVHFTNVVENIVLGVSYSSTTTNHPFPYSKLVGS